MLPGILSSIFLVIIVVGRVGSAAFELRFLTDEELANKRIFEEANEFAKKQIEIMQKCLDKYYDTNPAFAREMFNKAFGNRADLSSVRKTVEALEAGTFGVELKGHKFKNPRMDAEVNVYWDSDNQKHLYREMARFSDGFFTKNGYTIDYQARVMIHEATHQLADAGDRVSLDGKRILLAFEQEESNGQSGYVHDRATFREVRGKVENMHDNADSYPYFGVLCSLPGVVEGTLPERGAFGPAT